VGRRERSRTDQRGEVRCRGLRSPLVATFQLDISAPSRMSFQRYLHRMNDGDQPALMFPGIVMSTPAFNAMCQNIKSRTMRKFDLCGPCWMRNF